MGLISPGGENLVEFLELGRCSRLTTGTSGTPFADHRKGQSTCDFLGGLSGFLSLPNPGQRPYVESGTEPESSSPVLPWILGNFWSPEGAHVMAPAGPRDCNS